MLPYELWFDGEERKYLVSADSTDEAKDILVEHLGCSAERKKEIQCSFAREQEMKQRTTMISGGWMPKKVSHWEAFKRAKRKNQAKVIGNYLF